MPFTKMPLQFLVSATRNKDDRLVFQPGTLEVRFLRGGNPEAQPADAIAGNDDVGRRDDPVPNPAVDYVMNEQGIPFDSSRWQIASMNDGPAESLFELTFNGIPDANVSGKGAVPEDVALYNAFLNQDTILIEVSLVAPERVDVEIRGETRNLPKHTATLHLKLGHELGYGQSGVSAAE